MSEGQVRGEDHMAQHVKILGILHIVFGALCVLGGLIVLTVMGGVAGIVGAADQSQKENQNHGTDKSGDQ